MTEKLLKDIKTKFENLGENPDTHLKGLFHTSPLKYWDYVEVETLLTLQKPKTNFKDEQIFIMYHQITELTLKMMIHEIKQLVYEPFDDAIWVEKFDRLNRYTSMLIKSFDVMKFGMNYDDYNKFRNALTPASGFQSVQFRLIETYCTRLKNLINDNGKKRLPENPNTTDYFEHIYWKDAGLNRRTGEKTLTLRQFEEMYQGRLISLANKVKGRTLEEIIIAQERISEELLVAVSDFDKLYNYEWPMVHLATAKHYLDKKGENIAATGGSAWKKYLHPKFQQRVFFPEIKQCSK